MGGVRRTPASILIDAWVLALATMLCLPALTSSGLGLSGDLVFSPRQPLTLETVGLGGRLPRAVPLDALVGLLGELVPGAVLFRIGVLGGLLLAGWGAHRLASRLSVPSRVAAASFAVWNPYVVERLALGQWALLLAYGALFFVALASLGSRGRDGDGKRPNAPWSTWAWVGLASLTPTGGVLATAVAVAMSTGSRARVAAGCLALQLPWVLPSVLSHGAGVSDAAGVDAFRAHADAPGGVLVSVLGLGGIWDLDSVPTSRTSMLGVAAAVVVVASVLGAWRRLPAGAGPLVPLALGGLVLAAGASVPGLDDLVRWVVTRVPGGGLLRDSQKWLAPLAVLASLSLGVSLDRMRDWMLGRGWAMAAVVAAVGISTPFLLLPDAAGRTWDAVRPVTYPADFSSVRDRLAASPDHGRMVLLPWRAYRVFDWGNGRSAHDPAYAWFDVSMVGSDELVVGRRSVGDDDPATEEVRRAAIAGDDAAARLAALGVGWTLVYTDDPLASSLLLPGLDRVAGGPRVPAYRVPGPIRPPEPVSVWSRAAVIGLDLLVLALWVGTCVLAFRRRFAGSVQRVVRRRSRSEVS